MTGVSVNGGVAKRQSSRPVAASNATAIPTSVGTTRTDPATAIDRVAGPGRSSCHAPLWGAAWMATTVPMPVEDPAREDADDVATQMRTTGNAETRVSTAI